MRIVTFSRTRFVWIWMMAFGLFIQPMVGFSQAKASKSPTRRDLVVTQAIAKVGTHILTLRELEINSMVERALWPIDSKSAKKLDFAQETNAVLIEWVVFLEAKSFAVTTLTKTEVDKSIEKVNKYYSRNVKWAGWEVSGVELRRMLERKLTAKKFIRFKTDSSLVPVTDEDALLYYQKNRGRFGNLPFETFKENIKRFLIKQQVDARLRDWFDVLQRKYQIKVFKG